MITRYHEEQSHSLPIALLNSLRLESWLLRLYRRDHLAHSERIALFTVGRIALGGRGPQLEKCLYGAYQFAVVQETDELHQRSVPIDERW